jgi:hypothetical protein
MRTYMAAADAEAAALKVTARSSAFLYRAPHDCGERVSPAARIAPALADADTLCLISWLPTPALALQNPHGIIAGNALPADSHHARWIRPLAAPTHPFQPHA